MSRFFPTSRFKWINPKDFEINQYNKNSWKGYVLEADFEYPKELRKLHNNYPLVPDKVEIKTQMLSKYQLMIFRKLQLTIIKNWCLTFFDTKKCVLHYENFQLYLRPGLKLKIYTAYQNSVSHNG